MHAALSLATANDESENEGTSNMREWNPAMLRIDQPMIAERTWRDLHSPSDSGLIQDFGRDGP
jgi:hypothetical protein